jgi:hypothetical protein
LFDDLDMNAKLSENETSMLRASAGRLGLIFTVAAAALQLNCVSIERQRAENDPCLANAFQNYDLCVESPPARAPSRRGQPSGMGQRIDRDQCESDLKAAQDACRDPTLKK